MKDKTRYLLTTSFAFFILLLMIWLSVTYFIRGKWYMLIIFIPFALFALDKVFCAVRARDAGYPVTGEFALPPFLTHKTHNKPPHPDLTPPDTEDEHSQEDNVFK